MIPVSSLPHIASRSIFQRLELALAGLARALRRHFLAVLVTQPAKPIRPPATLGFERAGDEFVERTDGLVVGPILIFAGRGRVDDAGDVPRSGEHELDRPGEMLGDLPHAFG